MSARRFVDTNILMYAHDTSAGEKHERARAVIEDLWRTRGGVVSTQVLQELSVNLRRKAARPLDLNATREIVTDYLSWEVVVNTGESVLEALDIESQISDLLLGRAGGPSRIRSRRRVSVLRRSVERSDVRHGSRCEPSTAETTTGLIAFADRLAERAKMPVWA